MFFLFSRIYIILQNENSQNFLDILFFVKIARSFHSEKNKIPANSDQKILRAQKAPKLNIIFIPKS